MPKFDSVDIITGIIVLSFCFLAALGMVLFAAAPSLMEQCGKACGENRMVSYTPTTPTQCLCREKP